jgi:hypothetical protein
MITNVGKNIIAKYLIGEAPAYASFMALGCGPKPRKNVTTLSDVDTFEYSGTIQISGGETRVTGMATTAGLLVGMTLEKISGDGSFDDESQVATISAINSSDSITITTEEPSTQGSIVFYVFGSYSVLQVEDSSPLWKGARLTQVSSFSGSLDSSAITTVDKITTFVSPPDEIVNLVRITPGPVSAKIENALLAIGTDPRINTLEFESIRVPISSRGYVNDNGTNKIIFTAQLPSEERYEFTEVGIYSAGSNRSAGSYDSKTISAFSGTEGWELNADNSISGPLVPLPDRPAPPFLESEFSIINSSNNITPTPPAIKIRATNGIFANQARIDRYERTRYLDNVFLVKGDNSFIYNNGQTEWVIEPNPKFLQLSSNIIDLSKNSSSDLLKLAFSIVSINGSSSTIVPTDTFVIVEFANSDNSQVARMQIQINKDDYDLANNRYIVSTKKLEDLVYTTSQFSWKTINTVRIYASTTRDLPITRKEATGGVVTVTTGSVEHNLSVGDKVFISGVASGVQDFDGLKTVLSASGTTFTYATTSANAIDQVVSGNFKTVDDRFYVALDALRVDNINTVNPLYGLIGYSIIQDELEQSIVKSPNTTNFIEYRFVLDVT